MALSSATVFEVRSAGSDTNGGGYSSGGTDYSQQDAAQLSVADAVANGTTTITSATGGFTAAMVGNVIALEGGTGPLARTRRQITGRTDTNTITVDATVTAGTGITAKVGGAVASPGEAKGSSVAGNTIWLRGGVTPDTFTLSATANVSGGKIDLTVETVLRGYLTTRGDVTVGGTRPILKAGANSMTCLNFGSASVDVRDLVIDGDKTNRTATIGIGGGNAGTGYNVKVQNCNGNGIAASAALFDLSEAVSNAGVGINVRAAIDCVSRLNTGVGISVAGNDCYLVGGRSTGNGGDGVNIGGVACHVRNFVSYGNTGDGIEQFSTTGLNTFENVISYGNGAYGFNKSGGSGARALLRNLAFGANTSGATNGSPDTIGTITLTADPFTNAAGGDFSLNNTAGGGALLRGLGFGTDPQGTTASYPDVGAYQHLEAAGGLLVNRGMDGGVI